MWRQILILSAIIGSAFAEDTDLLKDRNGDGIVRIAAFGDSITFGVGDGVEPGLDIPELPENAQGEGYTGRLERYLGVDVRNLGVPGETLTEGGVDRFPGALRSTNSDAVLILEGVNDAVFKTNTSLYSRRLQKIINVAKSLGNDVLLGTPQSPIGVHAALAPFSDSYAASVADLAAVNEVTLVDFKKAWVTTCEDLASCDLYNFPEGLHPNTRGYDVMAQVAAAIFLGVDIFSATGAADLEGALGLEAGAVIVKPEVQP